MERFLILARESSKPSCSLQEVLAPLGKVTTITDLAGSAALAHEAATDLNRAVIHVTDEKAESFGGMMSVSGAFPQITAWSRAFAHLSELPLEEEGIWFVEDDVAGDLGSFSRIMQATLLRRPDLAAIDIRSRSENPEWSWWSYADGYFPDPDAAFQPFCRLSARLVRAVLDFHQTHGKLIFHEVLFASLAKQLGMKTLSWDRSAEFRYLLGSFRYRPEVTSCSQGISHPVKDPDIHASICALPPAEFPRKSSASLNSWTVLSDDYDFLVRFCRKNGVSLVAEFGPGDSTLAFLDGGCRVTTFEHDPGWMNHASKRFEGLSSVQLEHCPEGQTPSPETIGFEPCLVFVDGPPSRQGQDRPRLGPCTWGLEVCGLILLHDANRAGEQATLDYLEERGMEIVRIPTEKGLAAVIDPGRRPECLEWDFSGA